MGLHPPRRAADPGSGPGSQFKHTLPARAVAVDSIRLAPKAEPPQKALVPSRLAWDSSSQGWAGTHNLWIRDLESRCDLPLLGCTLHFSGPGISFGSSMRVQVNFLVLWMTGFGSAGSIYRCKLVVIPHPFHDRFFFKWD